MAQVILALACLLLAVCSCQAQSGSGSGAAGGGPTGGEFLARMALLLRVRLIMCLRACDDSSYSYMRFDELHVQLHGNSNRPLLLLSK